MAAWQGRATFTTGGPFHAFNTKSGPFDLSINAIDLGTMGGTTSEALGIHNLQGTVGNSAIATGYQRAFFLPITCGSLGGTALYQIPALPGVTRTDWSSAAYGLNRSGLVVGYAQDQNLADRAFVYSAQTLAVTNLNSYPLAGGQTPASLGWDLTSAVAVNDAGVMAGYGTLSGRSTCLIIYLKR